MSIRVIYTAFNKMCFQKNYFPWEAFQQNASHKMLSTEFRESMMGKNQGGPGYSFFLWGILHGNSYLISHRTSRRKMEVFKYLLSPPTHNWVAFILLSLNPTKGWLHRPGQKGGVALKVRWSMFVNIAMYHLFVQ